MCRRRILKRGTKAICAVFHPVQAKEKEEASQANLPTTSSRKAAASQQKKKVLKSAFRDTRNNLMEATHPETVLQKLDTLGFENTFDA